MWLGYKPLCAATRLDVVRIKDSSAKASCLTKSNERRDTSGQTLQQACTQTQVGCSAPNTLTRSGTTTRAAAHLTDVCLDKVRLDGNALVSVLEASIPGPQLGVAGSSVAE